MKIINNFHENQYRFLSNFYYSPIYVGGLLYPTVEHAYQAQKTTNPIAKEIIRNADTPGKAKRLGREFEQRYKWDEVKLGIMLELLRKKFSIPELKVKLLVTGNAILIEGNNWNDIYWGICNGIGENHLGKLLMQVREEIK
jgi:ribA/ribD-fused uncharacterized protein